MQELNIGIVTDSHSGRFDKKIVEALKGHDLDSVAYLGDVPSNIRAPFRNQLREITRSLLTFDEIGVPVFWIPGDYEDCQAYKIAFDELDDELNFVHDITQKGWKGVVQFEDYDFVFIPGSAVPEFTRGFHIKYDTKTGIYETNKGPLYFFNPNDLREIVKNPEKTVVFAHQPCYIDGERTIDLAIHAAGIVGPGAHELIRMKRARPVPSHQGDKRLTELLKELGIEKGCFGDVHEGVVINDLDGRIIEEGQYSDQLFGNPGPAKEGDYGILKLRGDGKAAMNRYNVTGEKRDYLHELTSPIIRL
ncbi:MAG: hypothetical protein KAT77_05690 [Nanoarchaeota archaeon]|nr:hypothetical protein [Nanoarchaeota archaeon]